MDYQTFHAADFDVLSLQSKFDAETVPELRGHFEHLIKDCSGNVLIDMKSVQELDSSGVGALVFLYKRLKQNQRDLALLGVQGKPQELLSLLRIDHTIKQYNNLDDYQGTP